MDVRVQSVTRVRALHMCMFREAETKAQQVHAGLSWVGEKTAWQLQ